MSKVMPLFGFSLLMLLAVAVGLSLLGGTVVAPAVADAVSDIPMSEITSKTGQEVPAIGADQNAKHAEELAEIGDLDHALYANIRACYDGGRVHQVWREPNGRVFHCLVDLGNGMMGDRIITKDKSVGCWTELSAFCPKNGRLPDMINWLQRKGATRFTKPVH